MYMTDERITNILHDNNMLVKGVKTIDGQLSPFKTASRKDFNSTCVESALSGATRPACLSATSSVARVGVRRNRPLTQTK